MGIVCKGYGHRLLWGGPTPSMMYVPHIVCATMVAHQIRGDLVSPWNFDLLQNDRTLLVTGEGKNNVCMLHTMHMRSLVHDNVLLLIYFPSTIMHTPFKM